MKFNILLFFVFTLFLVSSCSEPQIEDVYPTTITGYIDNLAGKKVALAKLTSQGVIPIDSAMVEQDGYFEFIPEGGDLQLYQLITGFNQFITFAMAKGDHIHMEADGQNVAGYYIEGSAESELIRQMANEITVSNLKMDSIKTSINHLTAAKNGKALFEAFEVQKQHYDEIEQRNIDFVTAHPNSLAAYFVVMQLQVEEHPEEFNLVLASLKNEHPNFDFIPRLEEQVSILYKAQVGSQAPELIFPNPEGDLIAVSSLRGNYVFIDFWASWCKPCRAENPNLKRIYELYHPKGLEVYGYSLDQEREQWITAIETDQLTWEQTSDLKGWGAKGAKDYGVQAIPATYLLDPQGIIIARDLRGAELEAALEELFN